MMGLFNVSGSRDSSILQLGIHVSGTGDFSFPALVARPSHNIFSCSDAIDETTTAVAGYNVPRYV